MLDRKRVHTGHLLIKEMNRREGKSRANREVSMRALLSLPSCGTSLTLSIKMLRSVKHPIFLHHTENRCYTRLTYFSGSALSVYSDSVTSNVFLKTPFSCWSGLGLFGNVRGGNVIQPRTLAAGRFAAAVTKLTVCNTDGKF